MKTQKKRRFITLIEIMIVMFLIAMITGVVAYNYRGSLEEGRAFKTQQGIEKIRTILMLTAADNMVGLDQVVSEWRNYVKSSPLANNPNALIKDGWGADYSVNLEEGSNWEQEVRVHSQRYDQYLREHPSLFHGKSYYRYLYDDAAPLLYVNRANGSHLNRHDGGGCDCC